MKKFLPFLALIACSHKPAPSQDPYMWLENIEGKEALSWVETQNAQTMKALTETAGYKKMESEALKILEAKDKIPSGYIQKGNVVNFWRDDVHVRGLLRKTSYENFKQKNPKWETVLDIDELAKKENENWIYHGMDCLEPEFRKCLVSVSRGGKDADVIREFDAQTKTFVTDGFIVPEAKSRVSWVDENTLLVASDFGPGTMTKSGYPRTMRLWKRGTKLNDAKQVFEGKETDMMVAPAYVSHRDKHFVMISRAVEFFSHEEYVFDPATGATKKIPKPQDAKFVGYFNGQWLFALRHPWIFGGVSYLPGSVVALSEKTAGNSLKSEDMQVVFVPQENQTFSGLVELKTKVVISILEDVKGALLATKTQNGRWENPTRLKIPGTGNISLAASTDEKDLFMYVYDSFIQASTLYGYEFGKKTEKLKASPDRFNAKGLVIEQKFARSKDGTMVPYFLVYSKKGLKFDGKAPTLQYGYGGFEQPITSSYNALVGKLWLEKGGVYVAANIRGGGEYGPRWHQAALKQNRQKAFDDFIAVSEDLIKTRVTSPEHLSITGRSNGGLLMGAMLTQRPDLYGAVVCGVPLLDMERYSQLLAGASWMAEYGDPSDPQQREYILKYSPYQNYGRYEKYPPVLVYTSTKDDRVHPGHARKMTAKMIAKQQPVMYYENTEGGHAGTSNFKQLAKLNALQYAFLMQTIGDSKKKM